jgi:hypothetical protein
MIVIPVSCQKREAEASFARMHVHPQSSMLNQ